MLKEPDLLKSAVARAAQVLQALLAEAPVIEFQGIMQNSQRSDHESDLLAYVKATGQTYVLSCKVKPSGQPRYVRMALLQMRGAGDQPGQTTVPVFIAPYLSADAQALCRAQGVGFLDFEGNARLFFNGVFIERRVATQPKAVRRTLQSLFKAKSAQVLRVLLREPYRPWRVAELAEAARVSLGHASNVRTGLLDREWAQVTEGGLCLSEPQRLLDAWRDAYQSPPGQRIGFYTTLYGSALEEAIHRALRDATGRVRIVLASFSAANWFAPYGRIAIHYFYADEAGLEQLRTALPLSPVSKGENLVVMLPKDAGVFFDTVEPAPGWICTSPVQTYLDLTAAGERGREAADHLRRERLAWSR